jgi:hypothetical protein
MEIHPHPVPSEGHALDAQPEALFLAVLTLQGNPTTSGHHAMPRYRSRTVQRSYGQTRGPRESGGSSHLAVRDYLPSGHVRDHAS